MDNLPQFDYAGEETPALPIQKTTAASTGSTLTCGDLKIWIAVKILFLFISRSQLDHPPQLPIVLPQKY